MRVFFSPIIDPVVERTPLTSPSRFSRFSLLRRFFYFFSFLSIPLVVPVDSSGTKDVIYSTELRPVCVGDKKRPVADELVYICRKFAEFADETLIFPFSSSTLV